MNRSDRSVASTASIILIGGAVLVLIALCIIIPAFGAAVWETLYCAFSGDTCVRVLP